jgi:hypothetical protein
MFFILFSAEIFNGDNFNLYISLDLRHFINVESKLSLSTATAADFFYLTAGAYGKILFDINI